MNDEPAIDAFNRGQFHYEQCEVDQAVGDFSRAIWLNPGDSDAYYCRGLAYSRLEDYDQAIADFIYQPVALESLQAVVDFARHRLVTET